MDPHPEPDLGYWDNPDATAEIMRDGWLDSGDLARADDDGYLWFFGRKKQIIVHDGSNISPGEVEEALAEHPTVELVGVVGIHDEVHGENVRAYVTIKEGVERPTSHDLIEFARERIGYKAPEEVVFLDEMPVNPTGKLDRVALEGDGRGPPAPARASRMTEFALFDTPIGCCGIAWDGDTIEGVQLPEPRADDTRRRLHDQFDGPTAQGTPPPAIQDAIDRMVASLRGEADDLADVPLDLAALPPFRRKVLEVVRTIPAGETLSYGEVAAGRGLAGRGAGGRPGVGPEPVPHRDPVPPGARCRRPHRRLHRDGRRLGEGEDARSRGRDPRA